jgi:hypothetical protein
VYALLPLVDALLLHYVSPVQVFLRDSGGSFYHVYRMLECLLRTYPSEVFDGLSADGNLPDRLTNMLRYIGYPPVCEMLVMLIALTPVPRTSQLFASCVKQRSAFLDKVSTFNLFLSIVKVMVDAETCCACDSYVTADQHSTASAQLLQDLIEKLSLEDTGEMCLQAFGQSPVLVELLVDRMTRESAEPSLRRACARIISFLLRRAAEAEIACFVAGVNNGPPSVTYVPNRLFLFRDRVIAFVRHRMDDITQALLAFDDALLLNAAEELTIKYSSYEVKRPFSALRMFMVEVVVLAVESEETVASLVPLELWKKLIAWSLKYAYNNIYHALLYRLVFAVLR